MDLTFPLNTRPRARDLAQHLRAAILEGRLRPGTKLPSTRGLAESLGCSRTLVSEVYEELVAEGYLEARRGSGTYVAAELPVLPPAPDARQAPPPGWLLPFRGGEDGEESTGCRVDFALTRQVVEPIARRSWARMWKAVAGQAPPRDAGPPEGDPELREAVADYLGRARGLRCRTEDVVVTTGGVRAVDLVAQAVLRRGDPVAVEEPGYPAARRTFEDRGAVLLPVGVDEDGLQVRSLSNSPLLVYVTPAHQYPLGVRMSVARRAALLDWARRWDGLVLEDDYDSELRFDGPPLPALAGMDRAGRVVYVGTFSKVLAPGLRVGYVVAPAWLRERLLRLRERSGDRVPWPVQRALAAFLASGDFDRHVRRVRRQYAERRAALREALQPASGLARLKGMEAGLHAFLELGPGLDEQKLAAVAHQRGVRVSLLGPFYLGTPDRQGWLLAYGGLTVEEVWWGGRVLAEVLREASRQLSPPLPAGRSL
jgi:GntR family transcriptional regulator/MocR family aminotransferase